MQVIYRKPWLLWVPVCNGPWVQHFRALLLIGWVLHSFQSLLHKLEEWGGGFIDTASDTWTLWPGTSVLSTTNYKIKCPWKTLTVPQTSINKYLEVILTAWSFSHATLVVLPKPPPRSYNLPSCGLLISPTVLAWIPGEVGFIDDEKLAGKPHELQAIMAQGVLLASEPVL